MVTTSAPERDAPYKATLVTEGRTLDHRTNQYSVVTTSALQARDSAGRRHEESEMPPRLDGHGNLVYSREVYVSDPVSHCSFQWIQPWTDPGKPTAHVTCLPRTVHYAQQNTWVGSPVTAPEDKVPDPALFYPPEGYAISPDLMDLRR
jgi:hypothetical protein